MYLLQQVVSCAVLLVITISTCVTIRAADEVLIADFEGNDYGAWKTSGNAFGKGPAQGTLPGQMSVEGFVGKGLVNSFLGGDDATGRLTSPEIRIERKFITFKIGGGGWADETCINLLVDGKVVRTATGQNAESGGSERLESLAWDVSEFMQRQVTIVIVDERKGGWGHINVDHIVQTDDRGVIPISTPPVPTKKDVSRDIAVTKNWLHFPVKNGGRPRVVTVDVDGKTVRRFDIELADADPDWWAPLDISEWGGKQLRVAVNVLPVDSKALEQMQQSDAFIGADDLYNEPLRSKIHYSSKRGWLNDPNGLVYFKGEYHMFYQHNPYGWGWGNMHWGHATSSDLVHWKEHGEVLYPDDMGPMFSGSAVVDWKNSSGFGLNNEPPLVLIYTAAGDPTTQCIAYSNDGRTFTKYKSNPVVKQISGGNRDPKVIWHEPTKKWVMVLYVEAAGKRHTVHFFTSTNLKDWELSSVTQGGVDADKYLFECPDLFELAVDGDNGNRKWVLNSANSEYAIGSFDGKTFKPELSRLADVRGRGFYAAQSFSDLPDGRRVQVGWIQAPSPGMSFNQVQSIPSELTLRTTGEGMRLHRKPIQELTILRRGENQAKNLKNFRAELIELRAQMEGDSKSTVQFDLRGAKIGYDFAKQELTVNDVKSIAPLVGGKQNLIVYVDTTLLEVFASDGLIYVPLPFIPKKEDQSISMQSAGEKLKMNSFEVYELQSSWTDGTIKAKVKP